MNEALKEARKALEKNEVPIGAIIVSDDQIIARSYNQVETLHDATAHAEMIAITAAMEYLNAKYLNDCVMYVTLEPCIMCVGATGWAQLKKLVYGAIDHNKGFHSSMDIGRALHPKTQIVKGILKEKCERLLKDFFRSKR